MSYAVYVTESFEKEVDKLSNSEKEILQKIFLQLKENPYVGDWVRYRFFREKRLREKRVYYLVYDDLKAVLVVAFGGKKPQKETINKIVSYFPEFREYLKKILGQEKND
jgi:mRNA-degrading endonuclease RelE of RelBE toxin-antitoxin system